VTVQAPPAAAESGRREQICRFCDHGAIATADANGASADDDIRHYAPDRHVDIRHLKLDVQPDFKARTVRGTATLRFVPIAQPLKSLRLDGVQLTVHAVRGTVAIARHSADEETVTIVFDHALPVGVEAEIEIDYSAEPAKGLYFRTAEMGFPAGDTHCWTQGEPHEARHWYPCFDSPNERSSTEVICHVPADMTVLSNGSLISERASSHAGLKRVHWRQDQPHANYLLCLVAGYLEPLRQQHGAVPLGFYTQPSLARYAANSFRDTAAIMTFYEQETGLAYPWDKYDQVTVGDFMWGGMENTTLTTLTQRTLFADETETIYESRRLDAHELAHQWFGNYVTCKDWSHLWLNEGFATYYTHLYEGHRFGRDALLYGLYRDARDKIFARGDDVRPIAYRNYKTPIEQFDYRAYPKGSWVLHMLRSQLGDDLFRQAIKTYLERHALANVETEDLREVFEELSGKPLDRFFDQWVYHGGYPRLKVKYEWLAERKLAHLTIEQQPPPSDAVLRFEFPARFRFTLAADTSGDGTSDADSPSQGSPSHVTHELPIDKLRHEAYVALPSEPTVVRFDPRYTVLAKVDFSKSDAQWEAQLAANDDVIGRLLACEALAKRKTLRSVNALGAALRKDPFYGVGQEAAVALRKIRTDEAVQALAEALDHPDARVRLAVVTELGKCYRPEVHAHLLRVAQQEPNPAIAAAALRGLGKFHGSKSMAALRSALDDQSFRHEKLQAAVDAIGQLGDGSLHRDLLATLRRRQQELDPETLETGLVVLARISQRPRARRAVFEWLSGLLTHPRRQLRIAAARALGELGDRRGRAILEALGEDAAPGDRLAAAAKEALAVLDRRERVVPVEVQKLRSEVRELRQKQQEQQEQLEKLEAQVKAT
jgi:aminopeptidase N